MAKPNRATQAKRTRERAKQEKQEEKRLERSIRKEKKLQDDMNPNAYLLEEEDQDLVGIIPGPQPMKLT